MSLAVEKFEKYIQSEMEEIKKNMINHRKNTHMSKWNIEYLANNAIQYCFDNDFLELLHNPNHALFGNFIELSSEIKDDFKSIDCFWIIKYFIEQNIEKGILEDNADETKKCYEMMNVTYDELSSILFGDYMGAKITSEHNLEGCKYGEKYSSLDMNTLVQSHKKFKKYYLDKQQDYTRADIIKTMEALYDLGIEQHLCAGIEIMLRKELEKREKGCPNKIILKKENLKETSVSNLKSDKEYKTILKQIKMYYDERNGQLLKPMTEQEVTYIASLMISLGYDRKDINQFYQDVRRSTKWDIDVSITGFSKCYDQLIYYSKNNLELQKLLEDAVTYLYETFGCLPIDHSFWYNEFRNVLFQIKVKIPNTFDYEYEQARNLLEHNNQKKKVV